MNPSEEQTRSVVIEKSFAHSPEKLWRALTEPALLTEWLLRNNFLPEIGGEFQFRNQPVGGWDGVIECKVLAYCPHPIVSRVLFDLGHTQFLHDWRNIHGKW